MAQEPSSRAGIFNSHLPKSNLVYGVASHCQLSVRDSSETLKINSNIIQKLLKLTEITGQVQLLGTWGPFTSNHRVIRLNMKSIVFVRLREGVQTAIMTINSFLPVFDQTMPIQKIIYNRLDTTKITVTTTKRNG